MTKTAESTKENVDHELLSFENYHELSHKILHIFDKEFDKIIEDKKVKIDEAIDFILKTLSFITLCILHKNLVDIAGFDSKEKYLSVVDEYLQQVKHCCVESWDKINEKLQ